MFSFNKLGVKNLFIEGAGVGDIDGGNASLLQDAVVKSNLPIYPEDSFEVPPDVP